MKKILIVFMVIVLLSSAVFGARLTKKQLSFVNEFGELIKHTTITSVTIYNAGTSTDANIYSDPDGATAISNTITTGLGDDMIEFYSKDADYKCTATDGTYTRTVDNLTGSDTQFAFPTYLVSMSSQTMSDSQSMTWGTDSDVVSAWNNTSSYLGFTPATNGFGFRIGESDGTHCMDFIVYTASGVGLIIDEGADTLGITGLTTSINASSNYSVNICTGNSTGATTIGNSSAGAFAATGSTAGLTSAGTTTFIAGDIVGVINGSVTYDLALGNYQIYTPGTVTAQAGDVILAATGSISSKPASYYLVSASAGTICLNAQSYDITGGSLTTYLPGTITTSAGDIYQIASGTMTQKASQGYILLNGGTGTINSGDWYVTTTGSISHKPSSNYTLLTPGTITVDGDWKQTTTGSVSIKPSGSYMLSSAGTVTIDGDLRMVSTGSASFKPVGTFEVDAGTVTLDQALGRKYVAKDGASRTLLASESGGVFSNIDPTNTTNSLGSVTYTLPACAEGLTYTFVQAGTTSSPADALYVVCTGTDTGTNGCIAGSSTIAGKMGTGTYSETGEGGWPTSLTLVCVGSNTWQVAAMQGTWTPTSPAGNQK